MRRALIAALAVAASGCVDSQAYRNLRASNGALSIEPASGPGYDYTVALKNMKDIGFDPDIKSERDRMALNTIAKQCPQAVVVKEDMIETGSNPLGPTRNYFMRIRCRAA